MNDRVTAIFDAVRAALRAARASNPAPSPPLATPPISGEAIGDAGRWRRRRLAPGQDAFAEAAGFAIIGAVGGAAEADELPKTLHKPAANTTNTFRFRTAAESHDLRCVDGSYDWDPGWIESQGGGLSPALTFLLVAGSAAIKTGTVRVYPLADEGEAGVIVRASYDTKNGGLTGYMVTFDTATQDINVWRYIEGVQFKAAEFPSGMSGAPGDWIQVDMAAGSLTIYTSESEVFGPVATDPSLATGRVGFGSVDGLSAFSRFDVENLSE